jgi:hypothetical protein
MVDNKAQDQLVAAIVGWIGAALILLGTILPERESSVFSGVQSNTLIQSGDGIFYAVVALVIAWRVYRTWTNRDKAAWVLFGGVWTGGWLVFDWINGAKIYPVIDGQVDTSAAPEIAAAGIGLYVVALGAILVIGCGIALLATSRQTAPAVPVAAAPSPGGRIVTCADCSRIHDEPECPNCGLSAAASRLRGLGPIVKSSGS